MLKATSKPGGIGGLRLIPVFLRKWLCLSQMFQSEGKHFGKGTFSWRRAVQLFRAAFDQPQMSLRL